MSITIGIVDVLTCKLAGYTGRREGAMSPGNRSDSGKPRVASTRMGGPEFQPVLIRGLGPRILSTS
jgi:hypothetical protein